MDFKETSKLMEVVSEILLKSDKKQNYVVSLAVGYSFYKEWKKYILPNWLEYCKKNNIGIIIIKSELISKKNNFYKKSNWQKNLIPDFIFKKYNFVKNICYLDTDILINGLSPNIFSLSNLKKINVVSLRKNLPFDYNKTIAKIVLFRKNYLNKKYPLNSAINLNLNKLYKYHNLKPQKDEFCSGVMVYNVKKFKNIFTNIFYKYPKDITSVTNGGEQTHLNYELQSRKIIHFIDYKFQAIWAFEIVNYYPFLYSEKNFFNKLSAKCIDTSLMNNYFLHFPGSWIEGKMWKNIHINSFLRKKKINEKIEKYLKKKYSGLNLGMIKMKMKKK